MSDTQSREITDEGLDRLRQRLGAFYRSGPYRIETVDPGRSLEYRRVEDYWGEDLAVNAGHYNPDVIRYDSRRFRPIRRHQCI